MVLMNAVLEFVAMGRKIEVVLGRVIVKVRNIN